MNAGRTEITIFSVQDRINFYRNLSLVIESQTVSKCYDWNDVKKGVENNNWFDLFHCFPLRKTLI